MALVELSAEAFESDVLKSEIPVLVTFSASWCGPCRTMAPLLEQVRDSYKDRALVVKVDIEDYPDLAARYNIRGVPTLLVFKGGEVVHTKVGSMPKAALQQIVESAVS